MSIKTTYNFKGIQVPEAIIRVDRLWGSSKEGWTALVGVYVKTLKEVPAVASKEATQIEVTEKIDEFNINTPYVADERGYVSIYKVLTEKFGGIEV